MIKLKLAALPTRAGDTSFYFAGNINKWDPQSQDYKFRKDETGKYFLDLQLQPGIYHYKITRGGWDKVEGTKEGSPIQNRKLVVVTDAIVEINIEGWQDQFAKVPKKSSASRNVKFLSSNFYIPQLDKTRRIWIYLPEGYNASKERYPVLYMHDGQNLFEDTTAYAGEWGVDEFLDSTRIGKCIVIGIDNAPGMDRLREYTPYDFKLSDSSSGLKIVSRGNAYIDFIAKTLKPYVDKHYRTKKDKKNTMIAGSSMGGLISMYAVLKYPTVFGGVGVFSPSFWTSEKIVEETRSKAAKINSRIFFYAGKMESDQMVLDMLKVMEALASRSKSKIRTVIGDEGRHNESTWRAEFPEGFRWMLNGK